MTPLPDHPQVGTRGTLWCRRNGRDIPLVGLCTAARRTDSAVETDEGTFPGVQFRWKPDDGSRAFWSATFADIEAGPSYDTEGRALIHVTPDNEKTQ